MVRRRQKIQHFSMMQGGCQRSSIPHISTGGDGEEHAVPGREENRQDDRKVGEMGMRGWSRWEKRKRGTTGEGLPRRG